RLFTREDSVEAAWAVVDQVLTNHHDAIPYQPGSWGPAEAEKLTAEGRWHKPAIEQGPPGQGGTAQDEEHGR
ncbi:MAG TPA: hypothetical protein VJ454_05655, partial [Steroidobacteraceae bacterium]|nr:hypothetical protein [Steroidobacteraceae bacterium]